AHVPGRPAAVVRPHWENPQPIQLRGCCVRWRPVSRPRSLLGAEAEEAASLAGAPTGILSGPTAGEALVDLLARRAHRVLAGVPVRAPDLPAQCHHGRAGDGGSSDLFLLHIVRVPVTVAGSFLLLLPLQDIDTGAGGQALGLLGLGGRIRLAHASILTGHDSDAILAGLFHAVPPATRSGAKMRGSAGAGSPSSIDSSVWLAAATISTSGLCTVVSRGETRSAAPNPS